MFSKVVQNVLEEAGWVPNRVIDISSYLQALHNLGYEEIPQVLKDFLTEFGGLYLKEPYVIDPQLITIPGVSKNRKPYRITHFDVIEVIRTNPGPPMTKEEIYEPRVGENMIMFGEAFDGRFLLHMTPSGKIYGRDGEMIGLIGKDYKEMLENILDDRHFIFNDIDE